MPGGRWTGAGWSFFWGMGKAGILNTNHLKTNNVQKIKRMDTRQCSYAAGLFY